ncbi:prephenate dehydratase [Marinoscillum furvescens]|uniref:Bifunctional chorismate mutase/prephenate dehydratase n=1 Tax=Marinoscillum furvescens DSM 4134 TaxID=1122208 RepID=A0A3D9L452_MARFU|nr:prephenate dehydratase [Marinoscillum furvescens]REE00405.1 chorismate mutase [Marinoscillum furvescens DSM 4134]
MLDQLRKQIDAVDDELIKLLNQRMEYVKQVGELKRNDNSAIYRPEREKAIVDRLEANSNGILNRAAIEAIFFEIFAVSRNYELPERIAYLGPEGSFTHQAAESRYGAMSDYIPLDSISSVFEAVKTSRARFGVVPIENNQEGTVQETIDFLALHKLTIAAEIVLPIHFAFASKEDDLEKVTTVYSRDIAFRQCKNFLNDYFKHPVKLVPVSSTSRACKIAREEEGAAAICAPIAARQYELPILYNNIQDSADNQTRFLIISQNFVNQMSDQDKTSVIANLPDEPGSLVRFLQQFQNAGINLCKVESRPAKEGTTFKYVFFVEFEGHFNDPKIQNTIKPYKDNITWLGSYVQLC